MRVQFHVWLTHIHWLTHTHIFFYWIAVCMLFSIIHLTNSFFQTRYQYLVGIKMTAPNIRTTYIDRPHKITLSNTCPAHTVHTQEYNCRTSKVKYNCSGVLWIEFSYSLTCVAWRAYGLNLSFPLHCYSAHTLIPLILIWYSSFHSPIFLVGCYYWLLWYLLYRHMFIEHEQLQVMRALVLTEMQCNSDSHAVLV